jgi:hypothetical protein
MCTVIEVSKQQQGNHIILTQTEARSELVQAQRVITEAKEKRGASTVRLPETPTSKIGHHKAPPTSLGKKGTQRRKQLDHVNGMWMLTRKPLPSVSKINYFTEFTFDHKL